MDSCSQQTSCARSPLNSTLGKSTPPVSSIVMEADASDYAQNPPLDGGNPSLLRRQRRIEVAAKRAALQSLWSPGFNGGQSALD
jgi:hypothetical protein